MASITKRDGKYRVQILNNGKRESKTFDTKRDASEWAARRELEIAQLQNELPGDIFTLLQALEKYSNEVSVHKKGARWEQIRLRAFESLYLPLKKPMSKVNEQDIILFRDSRLKNVSPGTVLREIGLLSSVFEAARMEWRWIQDNPIKNIRKPQSPKHRERTLQWTEIRKILRTLDYSKDCRVESTKQAVAYCFLVALRTGMRAGELTGLTWDRVHDDFILLVETKNGTSRNVPLSRRASFYISKMKGWHDKSVFGLKPQTLDALFRKYRQSAGLEGFTWHDTRHTAATMLSKKLDVLDLCKMFGWKDPKMAMVYYNPTASSIAKLLD